MRDGPSLSEIVAGNVRAELARRSIPRRVAAAAMGRSVSAANKRLSGKVSLNVDDLARLADLLQMAPLDLIPHGGDDDPGPPDLPAAAAAVA